MIKLFILFVLGVPVFVVLMKFVLIVQEVIEERKTTQNEH